MKKLISGLTALAIMAVPITVFAEEATAKTITETSDPQKADAVITTEIDPTFVVTIPADTKVEFNALDTEFGKVELTKGRLDPGKVVKVSVESDFALKNKKDVNATIPYEVYAQHRPKEGESGLTMPVPIASTPLYLSQEGMDFNLEIVIAQNDWNKAPAGEYSDTVTFNVEYTDADEDEES